MRRSTLCFVALASAVATVAGAARAVPGPDSVAVVANGNLPGSVALATQYAEARGVPARQRCVLDLPTGDTISLEEYRSRLSAPLRRCLEERGVDARIEALVLARGVPLRVSVPSAGGAQNASLAAVLMVDRARFDDDGAAFLDRAAPGVTRSCGSAACLAARWTNPYIGGSFDAGWTLTRSGVRWNLRLVTMLHGRSDDDAARLIRSAVEGERAGAVPGQWLFMNGADPARGALDVSYDDVIDDLHALGRTEAARVPFDTALTGRTLAAFVTGTAALGATIEGNRFSPGALVDNLTSFGAAPQNFAPTGEAQVSIARWVALGVAGVHGTVDEPLNNCFPHRRFLLEYAEGSTLAEAYLRNLPYTFWRNLVLGDPMAAPWARRPRVIVRGARDGDTLDRPRAIEVRAEAPEGSVVATTTLYVDGVERARVEGDTVPFCLEGDGTRELLAVAQLAEDEGAGKHRPKGWTRLRVTLRGASGICAPVEDPDAAVEAPADVAPVDDALPTASRDAAVGAPAPVDGGCGCRTSRRGVPRGVLVFTAIALAAGRRRRSASLLLSRHRERA